LKTYEDEISRAKPVPVPRIADPVHSEDQELQEALLMSLSEPKISEKKIPEQKPTAEQPKISEPHQEEEGIDEDTLRAMELSLTQPPTAVSPSIPPSHQRPNLEEMLHKWNQTMDEHIPFIPEQILRDTYLPLHFPGTYPITHSYERQYEDLPPEVLEPHPMYDESDIPPEVLEDQFKIEEEKRQREQRRLEKQEQDNAYQTSVLMDKYKEEQKKQMVLDKQLQEEREKRELLEKQNFEKALEAQKAKEAIERELELQRIESSLPPEPSPTDPNAIQITFHLPTGERVTRIFLKSDTIKTLKDFIDTRALHGKTIPSLYNFLEYPKKVWDQLDQKLSDTNWSKNQLLRIETRS